MFWIFNTTNPLSWQTHHIWSLSPIYFTIISQLFYSTTSPFLLHHRDRSHKFSFYVGMPTNQPPHPATFALDFSLLHYVIIISKICSTTASSHIYSISLQYTTMSQTTSSSLCGFRNVHHRFFLHQSKSVTTINGFPPSSSCS